MIQEIPLSVERSTQDDSEAFECPFCYKYFRVIDEMKITCSWKTECPHCHNEFVYQYDE